MSKRRGGRGWAWWSIAWLLWVGGVQAQGYQPVEVQNDPAEAALLLETEPADIEVWQGDRRLGRTPLQQWGLRSGQTLQLQLRSDYYRAQSISLTLRAGINRVGPLLMQGGQSEVSVSAEPARPGAELWVDGERQGPLPIRLWLSAGEHQLKVVAGYRHDQQLIEVRDGEPLRWQAQLPDRLPFEPELIDLSAGRFAMGSEEGDDDERPVHTVQVARFQFASTEVTRGQFRAFVNDTGYRTDAERNVDQMGCNAYLGGTRFGWEAGRSWRNPGYPQSDNMPVVCVSWNDAQAFIGWLNRVTGQRYRLPSAAEWEYAARAGQQTPWSFGEEEDLACEYANLADHNAARQFVDLLAGDCDDGYLFTAPVANYTANPWGLFDLHGNVWEWTADCWHDDYQGAPSDGSPWLEGACDERVTRGGAWFNFPDFIRSAVRDYHQPSDRNFNIGFRLAHD